MNEWWEEIRKQGRSGLVSWLLAGLGAVLLTVLALARHWITTLSFATIQLILYCFGGILAVLCVYLVSRKSGQKTRELEAKLAALAAELERSKAAKPKPQPPVEQTISPDASKLLKVFYEASIEVGVEQLAHGFRVLPNDIQYVIDQLEQRGFIRESSWSSSVGPGLYEITASGRDYYNRHRS